MDEEIVENPTDQNLDTGAEAGAPTSALEAIEQGLGYVEKPAAELGADGKSVVAAPALDANGQPVAKPAVGADGKPVAPAPAAKPADKKTPDYTPPVGLNKDSMRRFQELATDNKAVRAENETLKAQAVQFKDSQDAVQGFRTVFDDAKVQPQQFGLAMDFIKAVNTKNYDRAAEIMASELHNLQLITGRDFTAPDPLKQFPDLAAEVAESKITRQRAMEIARGRTEQTQQQRTQQQQDQSAAQARDLDNAINKGGADVNAWCQKMAASDIDFGAKQKALEAKIDWLATNVHPANWVAHLQQFYEIIGSGATAPRQQNQNQPLRANGGAGGAKPAPGSMLEALEQGLGYQSA